MALNAGLDQYQQLGALMYFGSDEAIAGEAGGKRLAALGAKHVLCPIQAAGVISLDTRCAGIKKAVPNTETVQSMARTIPPWCRPCRPSCRRTSRSTTS